jgi:FkbM family methyltransferase
VKGLLQSSVNMLPFRARYWIKHIPGIAASQRWVLQRFLEGQPFVHTVNAGPAAGLRFEITLPHDKAVWTGTYEHEFTRAIIEHVRAGDICYDIGGYRGFMSGAMALRGALKVFVFEPLPANQRAVRRLCELNPQLPINVVAIALGDVNEWAFLKVMPDSSMGKLAKSSFQGDATAVGEMQVMVRKIDSLLQGREIPPPDVVKIDVEGGELDVLCGALEMLRISRPKIFLEAHGSALEKACSQQLLQLGYEIRRIEVEIRSEESVRHLVCLP